MFMGEILAFPSGRKLSVKQADPKGIQKKLHELNIEPVEAGLQRIPLNMKEKR